MPGEFSSASSMRFPARGHNVRPVHTGHRCKRQNIAGNLCDSLPESEAKVKRAGVHYGRKKTKL